MKPISRKTLRRITEGFPTLEWPDEELEDLVSPKQGIITGFQEILEEMEALEKIDLGETGPAGAVQIPEVDDDK